MLNETHWWWKPGAKHGRAHRWPGVRPWCLRAARLWTTHLGENARLYHLLGIYHLTSAVAGFFLTSSPGQFLTDMFAHTNIRECTMQIESRILLWIIIWENVQHFLLALNIHGSPSCLSREACAPDGSYNVSGDNCHAYKYPHTPCAFLWAGPRSIPRHPPPHLLFKFSLRQFQTSPQSLVSNPGPKGGDYFFSNTASESFVWSLRW